MQFQAHKVLSTDQVQAIVADVFIGIAQAAIELGSLDFHSAGDLVVELMRAWCKAMDKKIKIARILTGQPYGELYRRLLYERGFTYSEFRCLFDAQIPETEYLQYPVFEVLQIQSDRQRRFFISEFDCDVESYVKLLSQTKLLSWDFFLRQLKSVVPVGELKKHAYVSGRTGSGKSEFLKSMVFSLQKLTNKAQNYALVVLDPHGDLVNEMRQFSLNKDPSRLVYIDAYLKAGYSPVFNPLELEDRSEQSIELTAQMLVSVFKELMLDAGLSMQMGALLLPCIATLLRKGDASLKDLQVFMNDEENQALVALGKQSPNPNHANFFEKNFYDNFYDKTKRAVYTRLLDLLNTSAFYNLVNSKSTIHLEQLMNQGKVILFNLSKGIMGESASSAFGRFVIASIQAIAQRRAAQAKASRVPTFLFIDECQNYMTPSISTILTEARKFGLHLILANQSIEDLPKYIRSKILSNTSVKIAGRNDIDSLRPIARNFNLDVKTLLEMPKYHFYTKVGDRSPFLFKSSDFLVREKKHAQQYYLNLKEAKDQLRHFWQSSTYYRPITVQNPAQNIQDSPDHYETDLKPKFDF